MILKISNKGVILLKICLWSILFFSIKSLSQNTSLSFNHLNINNGLSNNTVMSICQDSTGFMWFGTKYGLNRFDGRNFKVFKNDPQDKTNKTFNDFIRKLIVDKNKKMWIQSNGLHLYHSEDNSFKMIFPQSEGITKILQDTKDNLWIGTKTQLKFKPANSTKIIQIKIGKKDILISELFEDNEHHIWAGTSAGLFELFLVNKKVFIKKHFNTKFKRVDNSDQITCIIQDYNLKYYIGTKKNGLYIFDKKKSTLTHFVKRNNDKNSLINNNIRKILYNKNGSLWIGTQDGLSILNPNTLQFANYQHDPTNPNSLSQNSIHDIFQDKDGSVWLATYFGGVNVVYSINTPFTIYQNITYKNSISSNIISAIAEDQKNNLWIGTEAGGLNYFNRHDKLFNNYKNDITNKSSLSSNLVKAIAIDKNQNIWIGTGDLGGLNCFDPKTSRFTIFKRNPDDSNSIASDNINCLLIDKKNKLFIGTDLGLNIYDIANKNFTLITPKGKTFIEKYITALFEDKNGIIWIGTPFGIHTYQNSKIEYKKFKNNLNKTLNFSINCFQQDSQNNIWAGTYHNGLVLLNPKNNSFKVFNVKNGLPSDNILAIAEDKNCNLWISTDNGLVKFNLFSKSFRSFNILDGLPDNQFNINSVLKDNHGKMFFGTYNGLVSFDPQNIKQNKTPPEIIFSNLKLFNIPVNINDKTGILKKDINFSNILTFKHNQNNFTIEFSALNFIKSNKNKYAYMLDDIEKKWNYVDIPSATYINLPAGEYTFLIKSANNDGIWNNNIKKIKIVVLPPIWKTWWAYFIYFSVIITITFYILKFLKTKNDLKQKLYFEKKKLDFFTNISHEIRTPLTLILGPVEKLEKLTAKNTQANKYALIIKNNTDRLYRLVNELLDYRKADSGNLRLYFFEEDIVNFLKEIFNNFQTIAETKKIEYTFKSSNPQILVYFDKDQMEKVFFNLLTNAFKFTQNQGIISLEIVLKEHEVEISIIDNGKGIAIDNINDIFKNFYQADQNIGTGIGLALSKSLVELHNGKLNVTSIPSTENKEGKTTFTVALQLGRNHLNESDISPRSNIENVILENTDISITEDFLDNKNDTKKEATILIVEDNDEVREFIKQSLESKYIVYESENGLEGWRNATKILPDLIISDVMMPVIDGLELCKKLKTDIRTSHIPIILLTAKSDPIHNVQGLQYGADIYITKPFRNQILELNIRNLLSLKAALQKKYSEQLFKLPIIENPNLYVFKLKWTFPKRVFS